MMVLIEGMDNTGKSTLASHLREVYRMPIVVSSRYRDIAYLDSWVNWIFAMMAAAEESDIIFDRFPIVSESVYGPILHGGNVLKNHKKWPLLLRTFAELDPVVIYCRPYDEKIFNWENRKQMDGVREHAEELLHAYDKCMFAFDQRVWYNYEQPLALYEVYVAIERRLKDGQH